MIMTKNKIAKPAMKISLVTIINCAYIRNRRDAGL